MEEGVAEEHPPPPSSVVVEGEAAAVELGHWHVSDVLRAKAGRHLAGAPGEAVVVGRRIGWWRSGGQSGESGACL